MKIVYFITRSDTIGGAQVHVRDLALEMCRFGHEVTVVVGGGGVFARELERLGLKVIQIQSLKRRIDIFSDIVSGIVFFGIVRRLRPDLIALHSPKAGLIGRIVGSLLRAPTVYTIHGWSHVKGAGGIMRRLYTILERSFARASYSLITVCDHDRDYAVSTLKLPKNALVTIHNGVRDVPERWEGRFEHNAPVALVTVARFQAPKDFETLLSALYRLKSENWTFRFIGDGPLMNSVMGRVTELGMNDRVIFEGASERVETLLANSDIFLLISRSEGFPLSILEAMRAALPVVVSDVGGCHEMAYPGMNGFVVPAGDIDALEKKLKMLIASPDLCRNLGNQGRAIYQKRFTFETMYRDTLALYQSVVHGRVPS